MSDLTPLFRPKSVALIGASADPKKYGYWTAKSLVDNGFTGQLHMISRTAAEEIMGHKPYASILDVPGEVDLAIIGIAPKYILPVVEECGKKGVKCGILVATGFGETGEEGKALERSIVEAAGNYGMRIMGPNCMGLFSAAPSLNASIIDLDKGDMSLVLQSGNFGIDINFNAKLRGLGYSCWATIGNQCDLRFHDFVEYIGQDEGSAVLLLYMEGLRVDSEEDGRRFLEQARRASLRKPIVAIKIGRSEAGARAAASHTGSLAGSEQVFAAALKQAGVIRVEAPNELLDAAEAFIRCKPPKGRRIAILTDGGGHGVMATDLAERYGFTAPVLSAATQEKLRAILRPHCPIKNPVDLAGTPEADMWVFDRCAEVLLADPEVDGLVIVGLYGGYKDLSDEFYALEMAVAKSLAERARKADKPVLMQSIYQPQRPESLRYIMEHGFPVYATIDAAMRSMGALIAHRDLQDGIRAEAVAGPPVMPAGRLDKAGEIIAGARREKRAVLLETEARDILRAYGFALPRHALAESADQAAEMYASLGGKVVMKIVSPDIVHKTEAKGVILNIGSAAEARTAYAALLDNARAFKPNADIRGVLVTPMLSGELECILGAVHDATFGPTVMFGLGGVFVEVLQDVAFRVAPINGPEAGRLLSEIRGFPLLQGVRGRPGVDLPAVVDAVSRLSYLAAELRELAEVDLNPVLVSAKGLAVADARMLLRLEQ